MGQTLKPPNIIIIRGVVAFGGLIPPPAEGLVLGICFAIPRMFATYTSNDTILHESIGFASDWGKRLKKLSKNNDTDTKKNSLKWQTL